MDKIPKVFPLWHLFRQSVRNDSPSLHFLRIIYWPFIKTFQWGGLWNSKEGGGIRQCIVFVCLRMTKPTLVKISLFEQVRSGTFAGNEAETKGGQQQDRKSRQQRESRCLWKAHFHGCVHSCEFHCSTTLTEVSCIRSICSHHCPFRYLIF